MLCTMQFVITTSEIYEPSERARSLMAVSPFMLGEPDCSCLMHRVLLVSGCYFIETGDKSVHIICSPFSTVEYKW